MSRTEPQRAVHAFLSGEVTKGMLLAYVARWQQAYPVWSWRYAQDALQPGDWVLDLVAPGGRISSFFLHPDGTALRLVSPRPLAQPG